VRLEATCNNCSRRFALVQILPEPDGTSGRCPFCGFHFARHYVSVLPNAIKGAESALEQLLSAVAVLKGMDPGFTLEMADLAKSLLEEGSPAHT
jgi:hypothetical protein